MPYIHAPYILTTIHYYNSIVYIPITDSKSSIDYSCMLSVNKSSDMHLVDDFSTAALLWPNPRYLLKTITRFFTVDRKMHAKNFF